MNIEHDILIDAPLERVWRVTADVEQWPTWTLTITSVRKVGGEPLGRGSRARITQPGQPESEWVVTDFAPPRRFAWESRRTGLRFVARHELSEEEGRTRNVLRIEAGGPLAVVLWPILRVALRRALKDENAGLKRHCEASRAPSSAGS
jgi:uncharacterized membrane protein